MMADAVGDCFTAALPLLLLLLLVVTLLLLLLLLLLALLLLLLLFDATSDRQWSLDDPHILHS
jgi:hypothetical protein